MTLSFLSTRPTHRWDRTPRKHLTVSCSRTLCRPASAYGSRTLQKRSNAGHVNRCGPVRESKRTSRRGIGGQCEHKRHIRGSNGVNGGRGGHRVRNRRDPAGHTCIGAAGGVRRLHNVQRAVDRISHITVHAESVMKCTAEARVWRQPLTWRLPQRGQDFGRKYPHCTKQAMSLQGCCT